MLKKLKLKFIIVIMTIVTIIFGTVFVCIMRLTQRNFERESIQMMQNMSFEREKPPPNALPDHKNRDKNMVLPLFTLMINKDHEISAFGSTIYDLSDTDFLEELADLIVAEDSQTGVIKKYSLRFYKKQTPKSFQIIFSDMSAEKAVTKEYAKNTLIIGLMAYIAFFVISILLAEWVTKPVEKTWNEQKQFIADASHELKTPLTVIMTNAEMLCDCDDIYSESQKSVFQQNILSMSKRMRGLVESLLALARMDGEISKNTFETVDFSKLVSDSILPFEPLFFERAISLESDISDDISVSGDADQLKQTVDILLDNAFKYSFDNSTVIIKLVKNSDNSLMTVSTEGTPLSKDECKSIFKRFYRVDPSRNGGESFGLGLSIADAIVQKHKGKIWAENKNSVNIFYVSIPLSR